MEAKMIARRVDVNQREIVKTLRKMGFTVLILSMVGKGCPDILVGAFGKNILIEIKDGNKPPSGRKLTEHEQIFHDAWKGQVCVIKNIDELLNLINGLQQ